MKSCPLTRFADEQCANESRVDILDRIHLGGVGVGEALWVTGCGAVFGADVPHVLVVSSWKDCIVLLFLSHCRVIVTSTWREKLPLRNP